MNTLLQHLSQCIGLSDADLHNITHHFSALTVRSGNVMVKSRTRHSRFIYDKRNNGRMPAFHRLDIGASKSLVTPHQRQAELRLGLYNAYNRNKPLYLDLKTERNQDFVPTAITVTQVSFFPILPYIGYTLKF